MKKEINLGKYKGYVTTTDTDIISVEYEVGFDPDAIQRRAIWKWITTNSLVSEGIKPSGDVILDVLQKTIRENYPFFEDVSKDGGGIEVNIPPMCLTLHKSEETQNTLKSYMENIKDLGFNCERLSAGIHLNIDYNFIGSTKQERSNLIKKVCEFAYNNIDFLILISGRKRGAQALSDMHAFLGDAYNVEHESVKLRNFTEHKKALSDFFLQDDENVAHFSIFNLWASKCGRRSLEVRWFGTTLDIDEYNSIVEFGFALIYFCKQATNSNLFKENFIQYILLYPVKYVNLINKISSLYKIIPNGINS